MTNLDAIMEKIRSLSPSERAEVYDWLVEQGWTELEQPADEESQTGKPEKARGA